MKRAGSNTLKLLGNACNTQARYFSGRGGGGSNDNNRNTSTFGRTNFDEMMHNLKSSDSATGTNTVNSALPRTLHTRQTARSTQSNRGQQDRTFRKTTKGNDDDDATFESLMQEGIKIFGNKEVKGMDVPKGLQAPPNADSKKRSESVDTTKGPTMDSDSLYENELKYAKQLQAEHRRAAFLQQHKDRLGTQSSSLNTTMKSVNYDERRGQQEGKDDDYSIPQPQLSQQKRQRLARVSFADDLELNDPATGAPQYADDDDGSPLASTSANHIASPLPTLDELTSLAADMTLLDDTNFAYFAPSTSSTASTKGAIAKNSEFATEPQPQHIPGQPIIPPGFTRYRVDVQYQGGDFEGWDKSTEKMRHIVFANKSSKSEGGETSSSPLFEVLGLKPRAKKVLEDALAVALDLTTVTVHATVMPEAGVHVRRLSCHVDIPSSITMQPRTVLQRATVWLQQKAKAAGSGGGGMPLAILSFYPCPDQAFDARYSSLKRVYVYRILNRIAPPLFDSGLQWHVDQYLDVDRMNRFASMMQGTQDFGCFADPKLGHSLRKSLVLSGGATYSGHAASAKNDISMRFFAPAQTSAEREVLDLIQTSKRQQRDATLSRRHAGYVGEDLLAEAAGTASAAGMRRWVSDADGDHGPGSVSNPTHKHHARKDEFKAWSPYEEQNPYKLRKAAEAKEALYVDYASVTTRTLDKLQLVRQDDEIMLWFVGKSFLRHQIRNMVAVLKAAGQGLWDERELKHFMGKGFTPQRSELAKRFPIAPVHGLTLWDTEYDATHQDDRYRTIDAGRTQEMK